MPSFEWSAEQIAEFERQLALRPHVRRINHISIPVRDLEKSKRFYAEVIGGRIVNEGTPNFSEVVVGGLIVGLSTTRGEPQARAAEFPHLALEIDSDQFLPMIKWLQDHGVRTHEPWTRHRIEGLMYFKDPSGNLIELYCPQFEGARDLRQAMSVTDVADLADLDYEWDDAQPASGVVR